MLARPHNNRGCGFGSYHLAAVYNQGGLGCHPGLHWQAPLWSRIRPHPPRHQQQQRQQQQPWPEQLQGREGWEQPPPPPPPPPRGGHQQQQQGQERQAPFGDEQQQQQQQQQQWQECQPPLPRWFFPPMQALQALSEGGEQDTWPGARHVLM
jgi:hypothetical protein